VRQAQSDIGTFASSEADYLLDYYYELSGVGEFDISITVREWIHHINNARSKLKDVVNNAVELRTHFEVVPLRGDIHGM
jgi:hypothetical protein